MKLFFAICAVMAMGRVACADDLDPLRKLDFSLRDAKALQAIMSDPVKRSAIVTAAMALKNGNVDKGLQRDLRIGGPQVMDDCKVVSLNHDGRLQILCRVDTTGRGRPTQLVAVFKHAGVLQETDLAAGEGGVGIGKISGTLKDLLGNGRQEIVIEERRFLGLDDTSYATTEIAPIVTNIWVFRDDAFALANADFKPYFSSSILPKFQNQLADLQAAPLPKNPAEARAREKAIKAVTESIVLTQRVIATGANWPKK